LGLSSDAALPARNFAGEQQTSLLWGLLRIQFGEKAKGTQPTPPKGVARVPNGSLRSNVGLLAYAIRYLRAEIGPANGEIELFVEAI
jgi:hypothetical protein